MVGYLENDTTVPLIIAILAFGLCALFRCAATYRLCMKHYDAEVARIEAQRSEELAAENERKRKEQEALKQQIDRDVDNIFR